MHYSLWIAGFQGGDQEAQEHNVLAFKENCSLSQPFNNISTRIREEFDTTQNWESKMNVTTDNPDSP